LVGLLTGDQTTSVASLARVLSGSLSDVLPAGVVTVDYDRSMSDRVHGRPGTAVAVTVTLGDRVLSLRAVRDRVEAQVARSVRGVVLSREPVSVPQWIQALADAIHSLAEQDDAARVAIQRLLFG
jgi:hypothetical protein